MRTPNERFISKIKNGYLALDNTSGNCNVEQFESLNKSICWLLHRDIGVEDVEQIKYIKSLIKGKYKLLKTYYKEITGGF